MLSRQTINGSLWPGSLPEERYSSVLTVSSRGALTTSLASLRKDLHRFWSKYCVADDMHVRQDLAALLSQRND